MEAYPEVAELLDRIVEIPLQTSSEKELSGLQLFKTSSEIYRHVKYLLAKELKESLEFILYQEIKINEKLDVLKEKSIKSAESTTDQSPTPLSMEQRYNAIKVAQLLKFKERYLKKLEKAKQVSAQQKLEIDTFKEVMNRHFEEYKNV